MATSKAYPTHIYEPIRAEIAKSYIKHEFRKLLWRVPEKYFAEIDNLSEGLLHTQPYSL